MKTIKFIFYWVNPSLKNSFNYNIYTFLSVSQNVKKETFVIWDTCTEKCTLFKIIYRQFESYTNLKLYTYVYIGYSKFNFMLTTKLISSLCIFFNISNWCEKKTKKNLKPCKSQ